MINSFGGPDNKLDSFGKARVVVLPVPYGKTVTYRKGTEKGPFAILEASDKMELFDEELKKEIYIIGINTMRPLKVNNLRPEKMIEDVERAVSVIIDNNKFPLLVGGEHTIAIGAVKSLKDRYDDLCVLYLDAHCDLRDSYRRSRYSHACVARRITEIAPIIEVGIRSLSKEEHDYIDSERIDVITMQDIMDGPGWINKVKERLSKNVYITIDLDVFDPSIMPSVSNPEPGGLHWHDTLYGLRNIINNKNILGFDVAEFSPIKGMVAPDFLAARFIYKLIGYCLFK